MQTELINNNLITHAHTNSFLPREIDFPKDGHLIISGITQSGKTVFCFDSLANLQEEYLYIDLDEVSFFNNQWLDQITKNSNLTKTLIIDIYYFDINQYLTNIKNKFKRIIIISWLPLKYEDFFNIKIYPLNFEEFLSFQGLSTENLELLFVKYSQIGGFPILAKYSDNHLIKHLKRLLKFSLSEFDIDLCRDVADNIGVPRSGLNIYYSMKSRRAVSKDKLYRRINELIYENYIITINEYNKSSIMKYYLIDPALQNIFATKKDFSRLFESMIVSELAKKGEKNLIYYKNIEIYISKNNLAILPFPFAESSVFEKIIKRTLKNLKFLGANTLQIITMNFEETFETKDIKFEAIIFTRWALMI